MFDDCLSYPAADRLVPVGEGRGAVRGRVTPPNIREKQKPLRDGGGRKNFGKTKRAIAKTEKNGKAESARKSICERIMNEFVHSLFINPNGTSEKRSTVWLPFGLLLLHQSIDNTSFFNNDYRNYSIFTKTFYRNIL